MPPVNVSSRFQSMTTRGISAAEVKKVVREVVEGGFADSEVKGLKEALVTFKDKFTKTGALELKREVNKNRVGKNGFESEFQILSGIELLQRSSTLIKKWGATSKFDPKLPTYEKGVHESKLPAELKKSALSVAIREGQKKLKTNDFINFDKAFGSAVYDLEQNHIGYRITLNRSDRVDFGQWKGVDVFFKLDGTMVGSKNVFQSPIHD